MLTDKEQQEIYMTGYREGFEEAIRCFDNFIEWMKRKENRTSATTTTGTWQELKWKKF